MKTAIIILAAASVSVSAHGQGFLNLNFESAYGLPANPGYGELVSTANALPDWTAFAGPVTDSADLSEVYYAYNIVSGFGAAVGLDGGSLALSETYSAVLNPDGGILQTGLVPPSASALQFEATSLDAVDLQVTLGGQILTFSAVSQNPDYTVYESNIPSSMDGQTEPLTFSMSGGQIVLDDIQFVPTPEPSGFALLGFGALLVGLFCHRNPRLHLF